MITRDEATALVSQLLDCFNTRQFDHAAGLYAPGFVSHPFGTGAEAGRQAWRLVVARYPDIRLVAEQISIDGDLVTVRSAVEDTGVLIFGARPSLIETFRVEHGRFAEWWGSTWLPELG